MCKTNNVGFIKIHRNIREWGWYDDANTLAVWVHILIDANYEEREWHGEAVGVGSMITSTAKLSDETGLSVKQVRTCLERLSKEGKIIVEGASRWTKITVCNYDDYMLNGEESGQAKGKQGASKGQTDGKQKATPKEIEETQERKKEKKCPDEKTLDFPFTSQRFMDVWNELVKQPKWKSKTQYALQLSLNKLAKYDEEFAIKLMEDAIERGWQGVVFQDTDKMYSEWKAPTQQTKPKDPRLEPGYGFKLSSGGFDF